MTMLLEASDLARHYRSARGGWFGRRRTLRAVDGVSFAIARGRTLGLVGESGCGKSTLAKLVLGMVPPTAGNVRFDGHDATRLPVGEWRRLRRRMQMVFQDPLGALDRRITIGRQIAEPLDIHAIGERPQRPALAAAAMDAVGLGTHLYDRYPHEISGGQRQRAVIARALVSEPDLLVCDEPVSALDVSIQAQVVNLLAGLQRRRGLTYLFISHDLKVVRHLSHDIAVMYLGRIVEQAPKERLFAAPQHPYTQALIAAVPVPDPMRRRPRALLQGDPPSPFAVPTGCRFHTRCPLASDICRTTEPSLKPLGDGHVVACHAVPGLS
jgi:peptide/nickel transport system ATP-binding protein